MVLEHKNKKFENKTVDEIAQLHGANKLETFFELISEDPYAKGGSFYRAYESEKVFLKHPVTSVCTDVSTRDIEYINKRPPYGFGSRSGTFDFFVSILVKYVKEQKLLSLEEAVKKLSTNAAVQHNLKGRGLLAPGSYADIVLIDMPNLKVMSTAMDPRFYPRGIEHVFVNGAKVVDKGNHTGVRSGKVLRR
jgi:N-acyl-D-amino-acid deacylase